MKTDTSLTNVFAPITNASIEVASNDLRGWASIRLMSAICNRNTEKLASLTHAITNNYTEPEIKEIWRHCKSLLTDDEIIWLEGNLKQLLAERFNG